jgi:hypothetical protein
VNISVFFSPSSLNFVVSLAASSEMIVPVRASTMRVAAGVSCVW